MDPSRSSPPDGGDLPRRNFLSLTAKSSAALFCFRLASSVGAPFLLSNLVAAHNDIEATTLRRVRPTDKAWPSQAKWEALRRATRGRLTF